MSNVHPILQDALDAVFPDHQRIAAEHKARRETVERLSKREGANLQRLIEDLIEKLQPDGYQASEILSALTASVKRRYDNQLISVARIEDYSDSLKRTFERAYESAE